MILYLGGAVGAAAVVTGSFPATVSQIAPRVSSQLKFFQEKLLFKSLAIQFSRPETNNHII